MEVPDFRVLRLVHYPHLVDNPPDSPASFDDAVVEGPHAPCLFNENSYKVEWLQCFVSIYVGMNIVVFFCFLAHFSLVFSSRARQQRDESEKCSLLLFPLTNSVPSSPGILTLPTHADRVESNRAIQGLVGTTVALLRVL